MRFEIKGGGFFAILVSLAALSGAVFFLGLLAGYDVGRQSESATAEVATTYTIPSAPLAVASAAPPALAAAATPVAVAVKENPSAAVSDDSKAASPSRAEVKPTPEAEDDTGETANEEPSPVAPSKARTRTASIDENNPDDSGDSGAANDEEEPPPTPRRHAFNIQIQAVMDLSGANQMIRRLARIGYPAHMVSTPIDGQTWYKVEVGPYATQEEAAAAQASMRQKYNNTYGGGHASAGTSSSSGEGNPANNEE
jgi:septal ring-binding cell division protein DamX